jgi:hypothetical protein
VVLGALLLPSSAGAEGLLAAFIGQNFGGRVEEHTVVYGGVFGSVRKGLGFELDFGYTPDFFKTEELTGSKTSVTTVMGNLVIGGAASRGVGAYASGGAGLIRANADGPGELLDNLTSNDFGINVGGGLNMVFGTSVGIRADIRYFRSLEGSDDGPLPIPSDLGDFDFWRGTVGLVFVW